MRTQDYHIFIKALSVPLVVEAVHKTLISNDFKIKVNGLSNFCLNDYDIEEDEFYFDVQKITNPDENLKQIKGNPTGGWIDYIYK